MSAGLASRLLASLRFRLLLGLVCVFGLGAAAMLGSDGRCIALGAHNAVEEKRSGDPGEKPFGGAEGLDMSGRFVSLTIRPTWRSAYRQPAAAFFTLYDPRGRPLARSANLSAPLPLRPPVAGQAFSLLRFEGPDCDIRP